MSATKQFFESRDRVLGGRVSLPVNDPAAAFEALAQHLGGRAAARQWVQDLALVARLERRVIG
jgi:hypothetical protein